MCTLGYEALKEFLGVLVYTKDRTKVLQDKCSTWAVFHRDVLKPAQREMEKLAKRGEIEFTFEYEPVYHNGKKRGNPDSVRFLLNPAVPDADVREEVHSSPSSSETSHLTDEQQEKWYRFMQLIQERVGEPFFSQNFVFCRVDSITDKHITIVAPTKFVCEQIEKSGADFFLTLKEVFGPVTLQYKVENPSFR